MPGTVALTPSQERLGDDWDIDHMEEGSTSVVDVGAVPAGRVDVAAAASAVSAGAPPAVPTGEPSAFAFPVPSREYGRVAQSVFNIFAFSATAHCEPKYHADAAHRGPVLSPFLLTHLRWP